MTNSPIIRDRKQEALRQNIDQNIQKFSRNIVVLCDVQQGALRLIQTTGLDQKSANLTHHGIQRVRFRFCNQSLSLRGIRKSECLKRNSPRTCIEIAFRSKSLHERKTCIDVADFDEKVQLEDRLIGSCLASWEALFQCPISQCE